jgi:hypothetical protein
MVQVTTVVHQAIDRLMVAVSENRIGVAVNAVFSWRMADGGGKAARRPIWVLYCSDATHKLYSYAVTDSALVARLTWAARFYIAFCFTAFC